MALGMASGCINHPGVEAVARCKQCNKPVCSTCRVQGPTGTFCSEACKQKNETFVQRAAQIDSMRKPSMLGTRLRGLIGKLVVILILVVGLVILGTLLEIPVLSPLAARLRGIVGL